MEDRDHVLGIINQCKAALPQVPGPAGAPSASWPLAAGSAGGGLGSSATAGEQQDGGGAAAAADGAGLPPHKRQKSEGGGEAGRMLPPKAERQRLLASDRYAFRWVKS